MFSTILSRAETATRKNFESAVIAYSQNPTLALHKAFMAASERYDTISSYRLARHVGGR